MHPLLIPALAAHALMPSCTWYAPDGGRCANGHTYRQNQSRYGYFVASNRYPLGTRLLLTARGGRRMAVTVADRVGHGTDLDLSVGAAQRLMGPRYAVIGRLPVRARVLSCPRRRGRKGRR